MKSLVKFIAEANQKFPILIGEYNDNMEDAEMAYEDLKAEFSQIFYNSPAESIVMYRSTSRKRMDGLYYSEVFENAEAAWNWLIDKTWHGFSMELEDKYIISVTHVISGPRTSPSEYLYFSTETKDNILDIIEEEDGEVKADKTYIKIDKYM